MTCKTLAFDGKLIGAETTDGLTGNQHWNLMRNDTKDALRKLLDCKPGDYVWLAFGERQKAVSRVVVAQLTECIIVFRRVICSNAQSKQKELK